MTGFTSSQLSHQMPVILYLVPVGSRVKPRRGGVKPPKGRINPSLKLNVGKTAKSLSPG